MRHVLVIGAGPAGLAAAHAARRRGASVTLLDSSDQLGGQYWRHLPESRPAARERILHHGWNTFQTLSAALVADEACRIIRSAQVFALESAAEPVAGTASVGAGTVHVVVGAPDGVGRERLTFSPDAIVLATGAHDRTLPFPGWDLPGVFTGGAAQALAKGERLAVGRRVVVAGAGPFLLPVAASLAAAGSHVIGVYEANRMPALLRGWLPKPWQLLGASSKGLELAGYATGHLRNRIPYRLGRAVVAAHGDDRVDSVTVASVTADWSPIPGSERRIAADAVCVSHGFTPRLELAIAAGCALTAERFVSVDDNQLTSIPGVYAAGEITGIGGVDLALAEGAIAGHAAAGGPVGDPVLRDAAPQALRLPWVRGTDRGGPRHPVRLARDADRRHAGMSLRRGDLRTALLHRCEHRVAVPSRDEAQHPRRPRHLPGQDLRTQHRNADRRLRAGRRSR